MKRARQPSPKMVRVVRDTSEINPITEEEQQARLNMLKSMPEPDDIDYSDIPRCRKNAVVVRNPWMRPPTKSTLERVQIDSDIIFWILRQVGEEGYQEKMNAMLRKAREDERAARRESAQPA